MTSNGANWIEVGALIRGAVKRELFRNGIEYREQKTILRSIMVIPNNADYRRVCAWLTEMKREERLRDLRNAAHLEALKERRKRRLQPWKYSCSTLAQR